jgi:hypothetical protein
VADTDPTRLPIALRKELVAAGYTDQALAHALRHGTFERPRRGAYVDGPQWRALSAEQRYVVRSRAAYLQSQTAVWASHTSAVAINGGPLWGLDLTEVHLSRDDGRSGRREAGIRQHSGRARQGDLVEVHGLRASSPLRASLEVATVGSLASALVVTNFFLHRGDFTLGQLTERYDGAMDRWPYSLHTGIVLRLADPRIESVGESRVVLFLWRAGICVPEKQFAVYDGGVLVARLDFADPERGFWIEFDGRGKYAEHLRAGEDVTDAVLREKRREDRVRELTGWRCFRITWADLDDPARLEARLRRFIAAAAPRGRSAG